MRVLWVIASLAVVVVAAAPPAWAYVDPSAGSLLLQLLLGGVAGVMVALRLCRRRLAAWLGLRPSPPAPPDSAPERRP